MELGSINLVVRDADTAMKTYLKLLGTNNVREVIKLEGLNDGFEMVDGYYMKTTPVNLGVFTPRDSKGRMGQFLEKNGEGIHHIDMFLGQDEFEQKYSDFKNKGFPISDKVKYVGKFSEATFWIEGNGKQELPVKFSTKTYHGLTIWRDTEYLDTPKKYEMLNVRDNYHYPRVELGTIMITVKDWEKQRQVWNDVLSQTYMDVGNLSTLEEAEVDDGRGNTFIPVKYRFTAGGAINLYKALNTNAPINKVMDRRGKNVLYHNICAYVTRDQVHKYWNQLEESGFAMVDPKPMLNSNSGNGNYFFFVHPLSTHGVLYEVVSAYNMDPSGELKYDWSDTETYLVPPDVNN